MSFRDRLDRSNLPMELEALLQGTTFLSAYEGTTADSIIVWIKGSPRALREELEFSRRLGRFLSRHEREQLFPAEEEMLFNELKVRVHVAYRLADDSNLLCQTYDVFATEGGVQLVRCEQYVYLPQLPIADVVEQAMLRQSFPIRYAGWSAHERIDYWIANLYRMRRQTGELGVHEDSVFGPSLVKEMRDLDPQISLILPEVLTRLAKTEMGSPDELIAAFNAKTGETVS